MQRYRYNLVYRPGSALVLADTLSRAYQPADGSGETEMRFYEDLAAVTLTEQLSDLKLVASEATIRKIRSAAENDTLYRMLINQISIGWQSNAALLAPELRGYASFCDELSLCDGLVFKGHRVVARDDILTRLHAAHTGMNACIERARHSFFQVLHRPSKPWWLDLSSKIISRKNR